ncbi:hypothetical protein ACFRMN_13465 [Streptomyces sp. NPDC056835]|uniref:hypothetical protein n=1 Tax=Streptomyces sp. NPDC056835 TaxID=3345956 RepID=UPI0036C63302
MLGLGAIIAIAAGATLLVRRIPRRPVADQSAIDRTSIDEAGLQTPQAMTNAGLDGPAPDPR